MMLRKDEGYRDMLHNRDEVSSATKKLSGSTGSKSKSPRVVGWRGETVEAFRSVDIDVNGNENVPSPLNSATSFQSGKMFWQKLLEEKHVPALSPSSGSQSTYSDYAEIHLTGSTVSSITDHSGLRGMKSPLAVDIPAADSLQSLSISSIDNKRNLSQDTESQKNSTEKSDHTNNSNSGDGKKRSSPVAYPFGMIPLKSPRFKTMSESISSPQASFDGDNNKGDVSTIGPPAIEARLSTSSWVTTAKNNKVKLAPNVPQDTSEKNEMFRSAYSAWQQAGLMKDIRDDSESKREHSVPSFRKLKVVTERRDSASEMALPKSKQTVKSNDVIQYYKAWQRAGLMKKNAVVQSKMKIPQQQTQCTRVEPSKMERNVSGVVKKAPDTNGNPYRVWQKVGLMKSGRPGKENHFSWKSKSSSALREQKDEVCMPPEETSKPMPLPLARSTTANVENALTRGNFESTLAKKSEDQDDEFTFILKQVRQESASKTIDSLSFRQDDDSLEKYENKKIEDGNSVSSHHRRVGGLSIQTASANGSTVDFFDQMREQLSPRENIRTSPMSFGRGQNSFGKDVVYSKSQTNSSSIFRASDTQASEKQGFEATIRAGKERLHSWEEKTPEKRNRPKPNHFQEICKSLESSSDMTKGNPLANLGGNRAIVLLERDSKYEVLVGQTNQSSNQEKLVLQNLEVIASEKKMEAETGCDGECQCSQSIFSGNDDLIDFFLPQMGMACTCRKQTWVCANPNDPTAIENVLRPWQVKFLHRFGITHAEELVKARHRSVGILGKAMRQWRMKEGMQTFRTSSCIMALDIWSKTCKAFVRSVRKQLGTNGGTHGTREMPRTLVPEISKFLMENPPTPHKSFDSVLA